MPLSDFLTSYRSREAQMRAQPLQELQQVGALQGILAKMAAAQKEAAFRGELQALGPNPPQGAFARVAAKFAGAGEVLKSQTSSLDRKATLDAANINAKALREQRLHEITLRGQEAIERVREAAAQNRITREEADRREAQMRESMIKLTASLRPAPQPRNLQLTTDAEGNQLIVNPDGTTTPLAAPGGVGGVRKAVGTDKPMTEFQGKAALYGTRSAQSDKVLKALEDKISTAGLAAGQATGVVGNVLMSSEQQRVSQAQRDFVNAVLRQESGAVISDAEFENAKKQYFPAPGDKPNVVAQKRANRQLAIQGFARMSGPKGSADIDAIIREPLLPGVAATEKTPQQAGGAISVKINSDAEYDRLPSGATFIGPDGKTRKKP